MVQGCGQPGTAARSSYAQADHVGAGRTLQLHVIPGENILVTVAPAEVNDSVPTEYEIEDAVKKLRRNRSGGPSGMRAEHLKGWLAASNRGKLAGEKGEEKTEEYE